MSIERVKFFLAIFKKFASETPIRRETSDFSVKKFMKNFGRERTAKNSLIILYI